MPEQAILNHAARVLRDTTPTLPADAALRRYFYQHRHVSPRERRAISLAVFNYYRWLKWLSGKNSFQSQIEQALKLDERFQKHPASVKPEALAARAVPPWAHSEIDFTPAYLRELQREPALWLRARPGRRSQLAAALASCDSNPDAPDALLYRGKQDLYRTAQFHEGAFEIQDLASQRVAIAAAPSPGQTWWDACAGDGGKMLHLSDLMQNKGLIWATDRSSRRLQTLRKRAARASVFNFRVASWDGSPGLPTKTKFDGVLVDAPCSGTGTWQRNPHARWTSSEHDVAELATVQRGLLENVCRSLKPNGRLIYAACTLTRTETTGVVEAFTAAHPEFTPLPLSSSSDTLAIIPGKHRCNGMFIAAWQKTGRA